MTIQAQLADGRVLEFPDGTDPQVIQSTVKRVISESAPAGNAGFSLGDILTSFGQGAVGSTKALTDVAGADNALSQKLEGTATSLQGSLSAARQAEMQRQEERAKRAAESGSTWEEIKAAAQTVAESPLQSAAQALGSFVPYIPAMFLGPGAAVLGLGARATAAATAVARAAPTVIGTAQGAGAVKSAIYDRVYEAEIKDGVPEEQARAKATAAQNYMGSNIDQIALGAGAGLISGRYGAESMLRPGVVDAAERSMLGRVGLAAATDVPTEAFQGGQEQLASNLALQRTGRDVPTFEGVAGQATQEGLLGLLGSAPVAAASSPRISAASAALRQREAQAAFEKEQADTLARRQADVNQTKENLGIPEAPLLALPAPAEVAQPEEIDLQNPVGNITRNELSPEVLKYVDKYRKDMGMPRLQSFSIEDIRDAMTQVNPEGEQAALDSILSFKTGYKGTESFTPEDVVNAAVAKNIASDTKGFADFLERTTGKRNLQAMSQPQIYAAFKSLSDLPQVAPGQQTVLPEGTNASRFTQAQYNRALKYVDVGFKDNGNKPMGRDAISQELMEASGLESKRAADMLLNTALKNGDLSESRQQVFRTIDPANGEIKFTYFDKAKAEAAAKKQNLNVQEQTLVSIAPKEKPTPSPRAALPGGYDIAEQEFKSGERPAGYAITPEGKMKPLVTILEEQDVPGKIDRLQGLRRKEADKLLQDVSKHEGTVKRGRAALESMEARGETDTDAYKKAEAQQARAESVLGRRVESLLNRIEEYTAPLQAKPVGKKQVTRKGFTVSKDGKQSGTFTTRAEAEQSILANLSDKELQDIVDSAKQGPLTDRAQKELDSRKEPGIRVKKSVKPKEQVERDERVQKLEELLTPMLSKFGLKDVALKIVDQIEHGAGGAYLEKLIKISLEADKPIQTMRHEALHALKDLGFFTPQQWKALEQQARKTWVDKYLGGQMTQLDGEVMSRLAAYKKLGLSEAEILEEAIADAFGDYEAGTKPPAGMIAALFKRLQDFFASLKRALSGAGYESAEDIFGKIEEGKLAKKVEAMDKASEKLSLAGVPLSTRSIMEADDTQARAELGLSTTATRGRFNNVREIAKALNQSTLDTFKAMDRKNLTDEDAKKIATAIADEVEYQVGTTAKTGTGLGWYSHNYPNAVKRLAKRFPELKSNEHAQSVFTALVAVTSNGERVNKNISNAVELYSKLRDGKPLVAMGNRRGSALENNLRAIEDLIADHGEDFKQVLLKEMTVKDMNAALRALGQEADGSYLADTVVPAAAVYFGPKLGAFYANLSGSEGYLTMDLWWTRSINRMRGLLMPKATDASINKFREMMDKPDASREEVVAATITPRNKYEEYGFTSELEHLAGSKEPSKKDQKPAWFKRAEAAAGKDAYDALLYEHNLEKMANTIYKNEYEMLEEVPFTASDRAFMYDAARKAQADLHSRGIDLTLADIQAALWYYEKRLYGKLSGKTADDIGYEEAIIAQADQGGGPAGPSVVFSSKPNRRSVPGGEVKEAEGVREQRPGGEEKLSLPTYFPTAKEAEDAAYAKAPPTTKEFKLFQGANTLVEEGRAVPMYHGSPDIFTQFRENKPIFVSPSAKEAQRYGSRNSEKGANVNVYPLWVRAETPFDYANPDHVLQVMDKMDQDGTLKGKQPAFFNLGHWENIEDKEVQAAIKALGFDSFYVEESGQKNLAVYNANQVKSITGNIGEFGENKDIRFSLARFTPERIDRLVNEFGYTDGRTYAMVGRVNPQEFVYATIPSPSDYDKIRKEAGKLDIDKLRSESQTPFIYWDIEKNAIVGHEGRHRMAAMADAGVNDAAVVVVIRDRYGSKKPGVYKPIDFEYITGQAFSGGRGKGLRVTDMIPAVYTQEDALKENFTGDAQVKYSLPNVDPRISERVDTVTTAREQKGFAQRITEAISPSTFSSLRQKYLNRYEQLGKYDKLLAERMGGAALLADQSAESAALMSDYASGVTASAMGYGDRHGGIPVYRNGTTVINRDVKGLIASLAPLAKYGDPKVYQYYQFWAGAKRGKRLDAEGREKVYTKDDFAYANILGEQFPEFSDVQKDLIAFNDGIVDYMVATQVLSAEQGKEYTKYADYIPFYRQMDGDNTVGPNIFSAISGVRPPKKLKGGDAPLADFLETLVRNTQSSIEAGMKNAAAVRAINVVKAVGDVPGVAMERLDTVESGPNIINVMEKGKRVSYKTSDRLLVEAVGSLNMSELPFMGLISGPSNLLRNLVTKDPGFMLANLLRDSLSAYVTSGQNMMPIAGTMGNFAKALAKRSPGYEALLDAGIIGGYELSQNVEKSGADLARDLDKKAGKKDPILMRPFTSLWSALETGTTASDAATRALVYERVLNETGNEAEALYRASEVMNFNRKGNSPLIRVLTAAVPFFNARLQGLDLFYRAASGNMNMSDAKAIQRKFFVRGATMMALSVMYYMMVADDEEYKKQEQETKDNNWIIPSLGIRVPIPFEVGVLFKTMPERITAYALGNDTGKDLQESTVRNLLSTFAFNPIPQTVKPVIEAATNFNFFTMRPIVGQGMGDVAPEFQVGPGTSKIAEMLGKQLGMSPMKVDHVIKGYTGTMGTYMVDATDLVMEQFGESTKANKRFEQLPVIKRFVVDPEARGTVTAYYELKDAVDTFTRTSNLLEKTAKPDEFLEYVKKNAGVFGVKDYVLDLEKEMKGLREMRRSVTSSSMDGEQKKNLLTTLGRAEQNLTANIQTVKKLIASTQ